MPPRRVGYLSVPDAEAEAANSLGLMPPFDANHVGRIAMVMDPAA